MGCCPGAAAFPSDPSAKLTTTPGTSVCSQISVDLLRMYKRPIDCYITHSLYSQIGSTREELEKASAFLNDFIDQKLIDDENCTGIDSLAIVRTLIDKIVKKGMCL